MEVVAFEVGHLDQIEVQPQQADALAHAKTIPELQMLEGMASYTIVHEGRILICGGVGQITPWRGIVWCFLAKEMRHSFIYAHRTAMRVIEMSPFRRIEFEVDYEFHEGHRWARMLGFECETPRVRAYRRDGGDITRYVKVRNG